jgi:polyketide biosynthesis acyl carrier protein
MSDEQVFESIRRHALGVMPELLGKTITPSDSLKALGLDSMARAEVMLLTMEELGASVPRTELARAQNIGDVVSAFVKHGKG